jgi:hypothetical protein
MKLLPVTTTRGDSMALDVLAEYAKVSVYTTTSCCEDVDYDVHVAYFRRGGWVQENCVYDTHCMLYRFEWSRGDQPARPLKALGERECDYCGSITKEVRCQGCGGKAHR